MKLQMKLQMKLRGKNACLKRIRLRAMKIARTRSIMQ